MMKEQAELSYLFGSNAPYIEELYEQYLTDPHSVGDYWEQYFDELSKQAGNAVKDRPRLTVEKAIGEIMKHPRVQTAAGQSPDMDAMQKQVYVLRLTNAYRSLGSRKANLDPLKRMGEKYIPELDPANQGLEDADMVKTFSVRSNFSLSQKLPLADIIAKLEQTYCGTIGLEFMHIMNTAERTWVRDRFESELSTPRFNADTKKRILKQITAAETMERYLHTKYVGQKRFSLEGGESFIAALDHLIQNASLQGVEEIVIGMAHRGRLNVLVNVLGKKPADLFAEFEGKHSADLPSGDVKYHNGFTADLAAAGGAVHVSLEFNPSHLEIVNPVVEGGVRARQRRRYHMGLDEQAQIMPVLVHGDSAFIGLGVNQANFNLSQTRGFTTGGTVHIVINNQIGFTTSDSRDVRSTLYCTDIAKMIDAPIFHVNGDDPEAVCYCVQAALDYRKQFKKDVVIDIVCFRKLGHNEGDDPMLTQPMMYRKIHAHPGTRALYAEKLVREGTLKAEEADAMIAEYRAALDKGEHVELTTLSNYQRKFASDWNKYKGTHWTHAVDTALPAKDIAHLTERFTTIPQDFSLHRTVAKVIENRREMGKGNMPMDWGMAETLAYASLLTNGIGVRISGEDSGRGTFSHRHAVLHDQNREKWDQGTFMPLQHLADNQAGFVAIDSILNEEAVLAYEYGYASASPEFLTIWEGQFGDFANGAQVAIDQFITSGETKWGRLCGLTVILPHGYDGQGPEHSSARLERWLQLCAEHNIQIVMMSEASQMFHVLRRQILRPYRKPLIIFMSKRLLRYKDSMSPLSDFTEGSSFRPVIGDVIERRNDKSVKRVILCAGQVYYDLYNGRKERGLEDEIAIIRIEQLYPFPYDIAAKELKKYAHVKDVMWAQEEPKNQGAWYQTRHRIENILQKGQTLSFAGRPASASPAVGYKSKHDAQLAQLVEDALNLSTKK